MTPATHRFTAGAHRHAAEVFRSSSSPAQRDFAPVLDTWAANADRRADDLEGRVQPDLFPTSTHALAATYSGRLFGIPGPRTFNLFCTGEEDVTPRPEPL